MNGSRDIIQQVLTGGVPEHMVASSDIVAREMEYPEEGYFQKGVVSLGGKRLPFKQGRVPQDVDGDKIQDFLYVRPSE